MINSSFYMARSFCFRFLTEKNLHTHTPKVLSLIQSTQYLEVYRNRFQKYVCMHAYNTRKFSKAPYAPCVTSLDSSRGKMSWRNQLCLKFVQFPYFPTPETLVNVLVFLWCSYNLNDIFIHIEWTYCYFVSHFLLVFVVSARLYMKENDFLCVCGQ